ncbi:MAG TPA: hypothetical protein VI818_02225 [Candidatus Thermoplasmatota archaeon]|nr:hypothetical protein [Candidatus Thermoplasmatota archaeon]
MSALRRVPTHLIAGLAVLACLLPALAQEDAPDASLEGNEGQACPTTDLVLVCFTGDLAPLQAALIEGAEVSIEFTAAGEAPHSINVINASEASELPVNPDNEPGDLGTSTGDAIGASEEVQGASTVFTFTVPDGATALYFWCDVLEHEAAGMHFELPVTAAPEPTNETGNETGGNETTGNETGNGTGNETGGNATDTPDDAGGLDNVENRNADAGNNTTDDDGVSEDSPSIGLMVTVAAIGAMAVATRRRRVA